MLELKNAALLRVNKRGEPMLTNMNMISHEHYDGVYY